MKRSVRWKFTIIFAGLMTVAIALIWCINNWFLSGYYQNYKIHTLEKGYRAIDAIIQDVSGMARVRWRMHRRS